MAEPVSLRDVAQFATQIRAEVKALARPETAGVRTVRRKYSRTLKPASPDFVVRLARYLMADAGSRWIGYEIIRNHAGAFRRIDSKLLEDLGRGMNSWWSVDQFARILSGPAWLNGQVPDRVIALWARSKDPWWRRAALVSTVALNLPSDGGKGDTRRTLAICRVLAADHEDTVAKAMSWALRALATRDPDSVQAFLANNDEALAARVKREVRNKLKTGLKNPSRPHSKRNVRART
jgi:3-methyladenine DNA glycosylase AlkD